MIKLFACVGIPRIKALLCTYLLSFCILEVVLVRCNAQNTSWENEISEHSRARLDRDDYVFETIQISTIIGSDFYPLSYLLNVLLAVDSMNTEPEGYHNLIMYTLSSTVYSPILVCVVCKMFGIRSLRTALSLVLGSVIGGMAVFIATHRNTSDHDVPFTAAFWNGHGPLISCHLGLHVVCSLAWLASSLTIREKAILVVGWTFLLSHVTTALGFFVSLWDMEGTYKPPWAEYLG